MIAADLTLATAQTVTATTGAVNGIVTDTTRAVVPGVLVSLSGPSLLTPVTTITDQTGVYRFSAVPPGDYTLRFELTGFATITRHGVHVGLGFTATVNTEMRPGELTDSVIVSGSPVVDLSSTAVTTHFDSEKLASLPGARDIFAILANTPGVAMTKMDVGGNSALSLQEYTAYGLRATTGVNRNEVEGIRVGGANGANDNYLSDFASFAEIAIKAVGQTAAMSVPGTLGQYVSKSGGDAYHGSLYADYQSDRLSATNIDLDQIALGVAGGPGLDARAVNQLQHFRDFTADVGGYLKKEKAWWYGAYRSSAVAQRYPWLLDTAAELEADVVTGKITYLLSRRQKLVGYVQHETFRQSSFFLAGTSQPIATSDALPSLVFPVNVWKGEYNAAVTDAIYLEGSRRRLSVRCGGDVQEHGAPHCGCRQEYGQRWRGGNGATHQPPAGQRRAEFRQDRVGRQPYVQNRRRVHERSVGRADFRLWQPLQLRLHAQQRRARAGADPLRRERIEERHRDVCWFRG